MLMSLSGNIHFAGCRIAAFNDLSPSLCAACTSLNEAEQTLRDWHRLDSGAEHMRHVTNGAESDFAVCPLCPGYFSVKRVEDIYC
jgi:hypothetical protein